MVKQLALFDPRYPVSCDALNTDPLLVSLWVLVDIKINHSFTGYCQVTVTKNIAWLLQQTKITFKNILLRAYFEEVEKFKIKLFIKNGSQLNKYFTDIGATYEMFIEMEKNFGKHFRTSQRTNQLFLRELNCRSSLTTSDLAKQ